MGFHRADHGSVISPNKARPKVYDTRHFKISPTDTCMYLHTYIYIHTVTLKSAVSTVAKHTSCLTNPSIEPRPSLNPDLILIDRHIGRGVKDLLRRIERFLGLVRDFFPVNCDDLGQYTRHDLAPCSHLLCGLMTKLQMKAMTSRLQSARNTACGYVPTVTA